MKRWSDVVFSPQAPAALPVSAERAIELLSPLVIQERLERIDRAVAGRTRAVVAVIESLSDPHNASAILRTCDALGVHEVHAIEHAAEVKLANRITKGVEKWMDLRRFERAELCAAELKSRGYSLYVADMRATTTLERIAATPKVALAFGNEHAGVSDELRACADGAFAIPMQGMVESFNVSVAAGIALWCATRQREGDLSERDRLELKARFLINSLRGADDILERFAKSAQNIVEDGG